MKFKFKKKQVKAFSHIKEIDPFGMRIVLYLDRYDLPEGTVADIYDLIDSLIDTADELE